MKIGVLGLGARGQSLIKNAILPALQEYNMEIAAIYDPYADRVQRASKLIFKKTGKHPIEAKDQHEVLQNPEIQGVIIASSWEAHIELAVEAMKAGKYVGLEVGGAYTIEDCWKLVDTYEQTRTPIMLLENCCYDWFEMNTLNMAQQGVFGEVIRAQGAYIHNLEPFWDHYWKNGEADKLGWRLDYNMKHRGDVYATHGLGPVAQALDIHRGDRMKTLVAMDTKSVAGKALVEERTGAGCDNFRNGDHTTTLIRTENGKVIEIQHNVMTPQPYNRLYQLTGTKGFANKPSF